MNFAEKGPINQKVFSEKSRYPEGGRACYFLYHYFCCTQHGFTHPVYPHTGFIAASMKAHLVKWEFFASDEDMALIFSRFHEDPAELEKMEKYLSLTSEKGVSELLSVNPQSLSDAALKEVFEKYFECYWNLMVTAGTLRMLDRMIVKKLREVFKVKQSGKSADDLIALSAVSAKPAYSVKEELAVLFLAAKINAGLIKYESSEYQNEIKKIESEFCFGTLGYFNEKPKSAADYGVLVKEALKNNPKNNIDAKEKIFSEDESARAALAETLDENGRKLMKMAAMAAYLKDLYKCSVNKIQYHAEPLFSELSKRSGKLPDFLKDLHPKEILDLLEGVIPDEKNVLERAKHNVVLAIPGQMETLIGSDATRFEKDYLSFSSGAKEFRGRVASKGFGKGLAKIVRSLAEFNKLNSGDVLVVTNTSPDFVAIMKKASAIVAEDGGITAHVSVVSREFGIPCIVGITNATDIFKDGDMVEVDAYRGIVKKLS